MAREDEKRVSSVPPFEQLAVLEDAEPRDGALQMAVDEALLEAAEIPLLRLYRWARPCVSFGYFESGKLAREAHPGLPLMRRWTGGGTVLHGDDLPYSLIVPAAHPFAKIRPAESYRILHQVLANALAPALPGVQTAEASAPKVSAACFENPVMDDLMLEGRKIAGAGQRRTRLGLLHQGSVHPGTTRLESLRSFTTLLAPSIIRATLAPEALERSLRLAEEKYRHLPWIFAR